MADSHEPVRNYPTPDETNTVAQEFPRIRVAIIMIGQDVGAILTALDGKAAKIHQHGFADIPGLQEALNGKLNVGASFGLDDLTDVDVAGAANLQVLIKSATGWIPGVVSANNLADWDSTLSSSNVARLNVNQSWTAQQNFTGLNAVSGQYTGYLFVPTEALGTANTRAASTAFVKNELDARWSASGSALVYAKTSGGFDVSAEVRNAATANNSNAQYKLSTGRANVYGFLYVKNDTASAGFAGISFGPSVTQHTVSVDSHYFTKQDGTALALLDASGFDLKSGTLKVAGALVKSAAFKDWATGAEYAANVAGKVLVTDEVWSAAAPKPATWASSLTLDFTKINHWFVMGGNTTLAIPTGMKAGQTGYISIYQGTPGGQTLSFASCWKFANGVIPALSTGDNAWDKLYYQVESVAPGSERIHANLVKAIN
ncbi:hypothetical protein BA190_09355 [Labrys sp. WJW]|uniref:hypothetical protein n=1 Tax=Labrys sp. WJW TaxID=1737983 RepID=UPI00083428C5|nr:hypothetical protein [Labrys sp. WJW]OCC05112.1 hypothetical protein BA190_09355 [Labrys sp. WJW]